MNTQPTTQASPLARLFASRQHLAGPILRLTLAVVMFPHGAQKLLGWFGGYGFQGTLGFLTESIGLPWILACGIILLEFFGPLLLLIGLGTRLVALGMAGLMVGAITTVHAPFGFFMNWSGAQAGEGFEYHLLVIGIGLALATLGSGKFALDRKLAARDPQ
jgi:putative oxidoreductase